MQNPRKPCIFCGQVRKRTKEHVWPLWISRLFPDEEHFTYVQRNADGSEQTLRAAPTFNQTIRCVCNVCNQGWMANLEGVIRSLLEPPIRGEPAVFDPIHQQVIAAWAAKMAMVFDYAHEEPRHAFTSEERLTLATTRQPPEGFVVWLASYRGRSLVWYRSHDLQLRREDEAERPAGEKPNAHSSTFLVGHLAFRVWKLPDINAGLTLSLDDQAFVQMIYPQGKWVRFIVRWPPRMALDDAGLHAFSEHFFSKNA